MAQQTYPQDFGDNMAILPDRPYALATPKKKAGGCGCGCGGGQAGLTDAIKQNPILSLVAAIAAGYLLAKNSK